MSLYEQLEMVNDEESFLLFVRALIKDREAESGLKPDIFGRGPNGWENHTIEDFFKAALRWGESTDIGVSQGLDSTLPWKRFATFLYCGKIYE